MTDEEALKVCKEETNKLKALGHGEQDGGDGKTGEDDHEAGAEEETAAPAPE